MMENRFPLLQNQPAMQKRALVILAAYDYESLQITLQSLESTVDESERIVVVLNGRRLNTASEKTERVARIWAAKNPASRFAVRPVHCGKSAFRALTEAFTNYPPLQDVDYICKIDDDLVPLKKGWLNNISSTFHSLEKDHNVGFVTGLINNNCWGFGELVDLFNKRAEYEHAFNYPSVSGDQGENRVAKCTIDTGKCGTVWTYPYMAWWIHQWTSLQPGTFVKKTNNLGTKQVPANLLYSIGCIYFEKNFWLSLDPKKYKTVVDEDLLHEYCKHLKKEKWAVMSEPMIHLFYRTQRKPNADITRHLLPVLAEHFNDEAFNLIQPFADKDMEQLEEKTEMIRSRVDYIYRKLSGLSFLKKWKEKKSRNQFEH
jgi:hypothetical protein